MQERFLTGLVRNISAGTRLALFLPVSWLQFRATPGQFALLAVFNMLAWLLANTLQADGGTLNPFAVALYLAQIPILLLACVLIAALRGNSAFVILVAVALSSSDLAFELAGVAALGADISAENQFLIWVALVAWGWLVAVRAVMVCTGATVAQVVAPAVVISALMAFSIFVLPKAELWQRDSPSEGSQTTATLIGEEAFHAQGELIER